MCLLLWLPSGAIAVPDMRFAFGDFLDRSSGNHREWFLVQDVLFARRARFLVFALDKQPIRMPILWPRPHAHEMPVAAQLLALKREVEVPLGITLVRVAIGNP